MLTCFQAGVDFRNRDRVVEAQRVRGRVRVERDSFGLSPVAAQAECENLKEAISEVNSELTPPRNWVVGTSVSILAGNNHCHTNSLDARLYFSAKAPAKKPSIAGGQILCTSMTLSHGASALKMLYKQ